LGTIKKNGKYKNGKQRWYCKTCKKSFSLKNLKNKQLKEKKWFDLWIMEGYSVRQLKQQCKYSSEKLYSIINFWLSQRPKIKKDNIKSCKYGIFDGTFLHRPNEMVVLMDAETNKVVYGEYGVHENSEPQMTQFFNFQIEQGLSLKSCTVDGNPQVIKILKKCFPGIIIQRCLVHIQRQGIAWCRQNPKIREAKELRKLFLKVTYIKTLKESYDFVDEFIAWDNEFGCKIKNSKPIDRISYDLKKARNMLLNALPNMFHFLENPMIPSTTNPIEGYFSRLKNHYRNHRGLDPKKRQNYFLWFFFLKSK
jgi:hypothetical protein